jgi:hypothetical protein
MARIRTIKPTFFMNDELAELDPLTRLLYVGLWTQADREGRMEDRPKRLKASVLPYDSCDVNAMLDALHESGHIIRYEVGDSRFIQVVNFTKHQMPHYKEVPSVIPAPDGHTDSRVVASPLTQAQRDAILKRDGEVCAECGATDDLTIDHIMPKSLGGTNDEDNLRVLCRRCNSAKNNRVSAQGQADVGVTMTSGREGKGREQERKGRDAREDIPDEKIVHSAAHPPCLNADIEVIDPAFTGSCWGFIVGQAEEQFGGILSHAERTELAEAITQGCIHGCTGEHPVECAVHIYDKLKLKGKTRFSTSRLWLKCIREDRMEVRQ